MGSTWPTEEQRAVQAAQRRDWVSAYSLLLYTESTLRAALAPWQEQAIRDAAVEQNLNGTFPSADTLMGTAAERNQLPYLAFILHVQNYPADFLSWPVVVKILDAFVGWDTYLDHVRRMLQTMVKPGVDLTLLEPIYSRLQKCPSDCPYLKRLVLRRLSDLLKV